MTTLKENTQKLITEVIGNDRSTQGKWKLLTDSLVADGVKSSMLDKPSKKTDANPNATLQFSITQAIVKGLPATWQGLIAKETKSLSESDKQEKRYAQQQLGSYYGKIKRHLIAFENPKENAPRVTRTAQQRIIDALNDAIDVAQKAEDLNMDIVAFNKIVKSAIALVK